MELENLAPANILSESVFEYILAEENPIIRIRLIDDLTEKAKSFGMKIKFENLMKEYLKVEKKRLLEEKQALALQRRRELNFDKSASNMTTFESDKYPNLFCGDWQTTGGIITCETQFGTVLACHHPIIPVRRLINKETGKEKMLIAYNKDGYWIEKIVDKGIIANSSKIICLSEYGVSVTSETAKYLVKYLNDVENLNIDIIDKSFSTSKMGWIDGLDQFMPFDTNTEFDSESSFTGLYNAITEKGNREKYIQKLKEVRKSGRVEPMMVMAASLASVLIKPTGMLPFILHLFNVTGKGKTVALMWAASMWGNPEINEYMSDPKNTKTAFELRLNFLNNLPFICDDTAQMKSFLNSQRNGDFSEFIYLVCSGKGKERANVNLGLNQTTSWKNITITSGEKPITSDISNGGEINRVIDCSVGEGYIFENGREMSNFLRNNYGFIGKEFVSAVQEIGIDQINAMLQEYIEMLSALDFDNNKEQKQIAPMALIMLADRILGEKIIKDGKKLNIDYLFSLIKDTNQISDMDRAYEFIIGEVDIYARRFRPDGDQNWGRIVDDYILINPNTFSGFAERGNFNKKMFMEWAISNGLSQKDKDRWTKKYDNKNYYWVKQCRLDVDENAF